VESPRRGQEKTRVEVREHKLGLVKAPDQKEATHFKIPRESGVQSVPVRFEGQPRSVEHFRRPTEIARGERDFGLSYYAPRAGYRFFLTESVRSIPQKLLRSCELA
jgi:hypothetical protein